MKSIAWLAFCFISISASANSDNLSKDDITSNDVAVLFVHLDSMEHKILEVQYELHQHRELMVQHQVTQEKNVADTLKALGRLNDRVSLLEHDIGRNLKVLQDRLSAILTQQAVCASNDKLREKYFEFIPKRTCEPLNENLVSFQSHHNKSRVQATDERKSDSSGTTNASGVTTSTTDTPIPTTKTPPEQKTEELAGFSSCREVPLTISGAYPIRINNESEPFEAFCEQTAYGGGWLVVQWRFDGSEDFNRSWNDYRTGFGIPEGEHWIGLDRLHNLTANGSQELMVEVKTLKGDFYHTAHYKVFEIGNEKEEYVLKRADFWEGTAGNGLYYHRGLRFSTLDHNTNINRGKYATSGGGWWHGADYTNLNGPFGSEGGMFWHLFNLPEGLWYSSMMIRPIVG